MSEPSRERIEAAMRASYDAFPQCWSKTGKPKSYEECYGCAPLDHSDDVAEMRVALAAADEVDPVRKAAEWALKARDERFMSPTELAAFAALRDALDGKAEG